MPLTNKSGAEFIGTFWLVLGGCGSVFLAAAFPDGGIGLTLIQLISIPGTNTSVNPARRIARHRLPLAWQRGLRTIQNATPDTHVLAGPT